MAPANGLFTLNVISDSVVQIIGKVYGFAIKRRGGEMGGSYSLSVRLFAGYNKEQLVKISNSDEDGSIRSLKSLEKKLLKICEAEGVFAK